MIVEIDNKKIEFELYKSKIDKKYDRILIWDENKKDLILQLSTKLKDNFIKDTNFFYNNWINNNKELIFYIVNYFYWSKPLKKNLHNELLYSPDLPFYKNNLSQETKNFFKI